MLLFFFFFASVITFSNQQVYSNLKFVKLVNNRDTERMTGLVFFALACIVTLIAQALSSPVQFSIFFFQ